MPAHPVLAKSEGTWTGTYRLHLNWMPEGERVTTGPLSLTVENQEEFSVVRYTWNYDNKDELGILILSGEKGAWTDSWHMKSDMMNLQATFEEDLIKLFGYWTAEKGTPDWGWRIEFAWKENQTLEKRMFIITPDGEEDWAVDSELVKS